MEASYPLYKIQDGISVRTGIIVMKKPRQLPNRGDNVSFHLTETERKWNQKFHELVAFKK